MYTDRLRHLEFCEGVGVSAGVASHRPLDMSHPEYPANEQLACERNMHVQIISSKPGLYSQHPGQIVGPTCTVRHQSEDLRICSTLHPHTTQHAALKWRNTKPSPAANRESDELETRI
jgi:hypothetical protein